MILQLASGKNNENFSQYKSRHSLQQFRYLATCNILGNLPSPPFISFSVNSVKLLTFLEFFDKESNQTKLLVSNSSNNEEQRKNLTKTNQGKSNLCQHFRNPLPFFLPPKFIPFRFMHFICKPSNC